LQPDRWRADDAPVHPALAALPLEEKGFVLAALLSHVSAGDAAAWLTGDAGARCAAAITTLAAAPKPERAAALAGLIALLRAPVPSGIERIHPGWLRERLEREPSAVIRAVAAGLPSAVERLADQIIAERGERDAAAAPLGASAVAELRRVVFAGLIPLDGPGAPAAPRVRELLALAPEALVDAIEVIGADTLGKSLRGASGAVVARAAAALGDKLARVVIASAAAQGTPETRDRARASVAWLSHAERGVRNVPWGLGVLALAVELQDDLAAITALAQRLPPERGRQLLTAAGSESWVA